MKAFVVSEPGRFEFRDAPEPLPSDDEALLGLDYVGLCGTDLATFRGANPLVSYPRIPGHEVAATVLSVGRRVPPSIRPGMRATVSPCRECRACRACRTGRANACERLAVLGVQRDGALTERIVAPWSRVFTSGTLPGEALAFAEPLTIGLHALRRGRLAEGETLVVLGCGGIGMGVVAFGVAMGARVIAVDIQQPKVDLACALGAAAGVNPLRDDPACSVAALTGSRGADLVVEAVGIPETFRRAIDLAGYAARVVYIGYCKAPVSYDAVPFVRKELDILGSRNAEPEDFPPAIALLEAGKYPCRDMISRVFDFEQAGDALRYWDAHQDQVRKILVRVAH